MKILAIIGSPRVKGNTYKAVEEIRSELAGLDEDLNFDYLFLKDYHLTLCTGCFTCFSRGEDKCPLKDDLQAIKDKMNEAEGIILAAPTYALGVPALMKNFIDRMAYSSHRPYFFDKVFLAVTTTGGVMGMKQTLYQLAMLAAGGRLAAKLGLSWPPIPMKGFEKRTRRSIQRATRLFYRQLGQRIRKTPGVADWFYFHAFKAFTDTKPYQKACPADFDYYKEKNEYFYPLAGHPFRRLMGKMARGMMHLSIGKMVKEPESSEGL